ncbi:MAG: helix-turn-helix domain-containing protein [Oscillospiraceae bacterium]|nr:helix-turn-helix domain-containing protein [Oscillospiraceae bacterium]
MDKKSIGAFLSALRRSRGLTQQELADRLNVSNKTVSKWERDESAPDLGLIPVLAELFEVSCDEILLGQRLVREPAGQHGNPNVDRQIKRLAGSAANRFFSYSLVSILLSAVGLLLLYTTAYSMYAPILAFGCCAILALTAVFVVLIERGTALQKLSDDDVFSAAGEAAQMVAAARLRIARYFYAAILAAGSAVILALPFILVRDNFYLDSVISFEYYLELLPLMLTGMIITAAVLAGKLLPRRAHPLTPLLKKMTLLQLVPTGVLVTGVFALNFIIHEGNAGYAVLPLLAAALGCLIYSFTCIRKSAPEHRRVMKAMAGRNFFYVLAMFLLFGAVDVYSFRWETGPWQTEGSIKPFFLSLIILFAVGITVVFQKIRERLQPTIAGEEPKP